MSIKHEKIFRLCLKVVTNEFMKIDDAIRQMLYILLLKLDLNVVRNPIICWDCAEIAKKCLNFKLTCLNTERIILLVSAGKENIKRNINVIYKESEYLERVGDDDLDICRICMVQLKRNSLLFFETVRAGTTMFETVSGYLPEIDINTIDNPMICTSCRGNLKCFFKFVLNCLYIQNGR